MSTHKAAIDQFQCSIGGIWCPGITDMYGVAYTRSFPSGVRLMFVLQHLRSAGERYAVGYQRLLDGQFLIELNE